MESRRNVKGITNLTTSNISRFLLSFISVGTVAVFCVPTGTVHSSCEYLKPMRFSSQSDSSESYSVNKKGVFALIEHDESVLFNDYSCHDFGLTNDVECVDLTSSYRNRVMEADPFYYPLDSFKRILYFDFSRSDCDPLWGLNSIKNTSFVELADFELSFPHNYYSITNDPKFTTSSSDTTKQYYLPKIHAPEAWDIEVGSSNVVVGIIDTGVKTTVSDLNAARFPSSLSINVVNSQLSPFNPTYEHGTAVAGIMGAIKNNSTHIAGITENVIFSTIRADDTSNPDGHENVLDIVSAINAASGWNIPIVNYSGGFLSTDYQFGVCDANLEVLRQAFLNFNGLFVVAAGNALSGFDIEGQTKVYPASWNLKNIISVAASTSSDSKAYFSCYGPNTVDLFAPGVGIISTDFASTSGMDGTSVAAPQVTAAAALLLSHYPTMCPYGIKKSITANVTSISGLSTYCKSGGLLNIYQALCYPHTHAYSYRRVSDLKHKKTCPCGNSSLEMHEWDYGQTYIDMNGLTHGNCALCGASFIIG